MIIDVHRHMWSVQERYPSDFADLPGQELSATPGLDWRRTTREMIDEMDGAGVDVAVLIVADFASRLGEPPFSIEEENRFIAEARDLYPERIIAFYGVDPRRPGAADGFQKAIEELKVSGLKLHPAAGYFPHDRACYPLYELCDAHDLTVLFHSGPAGFHPKLDGRFSHPLEFDQVASDFPHLGIIMGHAGGEWWEDCVTIARKHPNMFLELAEWQADLRDKPERALPAIDAMLKTLGRERVVWGSDLPGLRAVMSLREYVELFRDLPTLGKGHGLAFDDNDVDAILGGNAARILRLK
ncbi:MAG: amidohydrolase [Chloroflexi bacterium]|nr:amidohydrolase [Chloroflexota bacterium]